MKCPKEKRSKGKKPIVVTKLPKFKGSEGREKELWQPSCWRKKKNNCGNQVAEIVGEKKGIVATKLPKMRGKKKKSQVAEKCSQWPVSCSTSSVNLLPRPLQQSHLWCLSYHISLLQNSLENWQKFSCTKYNPRKINKKHCMLHATYFLYVW